MPERTHKPRIAILDLTDPYEYVPAIILRMDEDVTIITYEFNLHSWYYPENATVALLKTVLEEAVNDLILLGHNGGGGRRIAESVCIKDRNKVIVMSNSPLVEAEKDFYRSLGISQFALRSEVPDLVVQTFEPESLCQLA